MPQLKPDILIIGLDPAGVETAMGAAAAGIKVALVTQGPLNGRPSGGLDPLHRLAALGVRVIEGGARFIDRNQVRVGETLIAARRFLLALPAWLIEPDIAGLEAAPRWVSAGPGKTVLIFGEGGEAPALAQAVHNEGSRAIIVSPGPFLPGVDAEARDALIAHLRRAGSEILTPLALAGARVEPCPAGFMLWPHQGPPLGFTHWACALEGPPLLEGLGLEEAGVVVKAGRAHCDAGLTTSNALVLALGATRCPLTQASMAPAEATVALAKLLRHADDALGVFTLPRVVSGPLTLIEAGETAAALAGRKGNDLRYYRQPLQGGGFIKVATDRRFRPLAITVLGRHAALLAAPLLQCLKDQRPLLDLADLPVPALDEAQAILAIGRLALAEQMRASGAPPLLCTPC